MGTRNVIWLIAILAVGGIVWAAAGFRWALLAAVAALVVSEAVERSRRARRLKESGDETVSPLRRLWTSRRSD
jgi:hypothetical protein